MKEKEISMNGDFVKITSIGWNKLSVWCPTCFNYHQTLQIDVLSRKFESILFLPLYRLLTQCCLAGRIYGSISEIYQQFMRWWRRGFWLYLNRKDMMDFAGRGRRKERSVGRKKTLLKKWHAPKWNVSSTQLDSRGVRVLLNIFFVQLTKLSLGPSPLRFCINLFHANIREKKTSRSYCHRRETFSNEKKTTIKIYRQRLKINVSWVLLIAAIRTVDLAPEKDSLTQFRSLRLSLSSFFWKVN